MDLKKRLKSINLSLTLSFFGFILLTFLVITALVGLIIALLVSEGALMPGNSQYNVGGFLLQLLLWTLIVGAVLTLLVSRFLSKPLGKIRDAINSLASGDYSARLHFSGFFSRIATFRNLTNDFNKMAEELEQTEMLRSDFVNNFSHEFKTPIVSIAGFAKLLKRGSLTAEEQNEYLDVIEEESLRLAQMATNVMELTKVENQNILTGTSRYNLSEQIRTCILMLEGKWTRKHIELSLPMEEYYITGNEDLLKEVWINLLDNAIKFSPEYGNVSVRIHQTEDKMQISFSNFGDNIPLEKHEKIFNKFYQADESHSSEGYGVGLAIVKKVVDLHKGEISVVSEGGKTTFTVQLPADAR